MASQSLKKRIQHEAYQLVFWQLAGIVLLAFVFGLVRNIYSGLSVLAGGAAYGLPNLLFVWRVFRFVGSKQMTQFVFAFFAGEMMKLVFSGFLFVLIVKTLPISLLFALIGLIGALVSFWIACMWYFSRKN